jgi:hypothetical protein
MATGLPNGLELDSASGLISGIVNSKGSCSVDLSAIGDATTTATLEMTFSDDLARPVIVSSSEATVEPNQPFKYTIDAPTVGASIPLTSFFSIVAARADVRQ